MIWYISNRRDSHSHRCVVMVEIQSWAGQACLGISFSGAQVNIINGISCQNLSHFDVAFVLKWVSHLGSAYMCVYV